MRDLESSARKTRLDSSSIFQTFGPMFAKTNSMSKFQAVPNVKSFPNQNTDRDPPNASNLVQTTEGMMVNLQERHLKLPDWKICLVYRYINSQTFSTISTADSPTPSSMNLKRLLWPEYRHNACKYANPVLS